VPLAFFINRIAIDIDVIDFFDHVRVFTGEKTQGANQAKAVEDRLHRFEKNAFLCQ
jgi:hypothetical protein